MTRFLPMPISGVRALAVAAGCWLCLDQTHVRAGVDNTATGTGALSVNTGSYNTADGYDALLHNTSASYNTAVGFNSLFHNTTGAQNTATGANTLQNNTTGYFNTADGVNALQLNTTGAQNTAVGQRALIHNTTASSNTAAGFESLFNNTTGYNNSAVSAFALFSNTEGYENVAHGASALYYNTTGYANTADGVRALYQNTTGFYNTACGYRSLFANRGGSENTAVGMNALVANSDGIHNTACGYESLYSSTGDDNSATGAFALYGNTSGFNNTACGYQTLQGNTVGVSNTCVGYLAFGGNVSGSRNTVVGAQALDNADGDGNIAIGHLAGYNLGTGSSNNIEIGNQGAGGDNAAIRIGTAGTHTATYVAGIYGVVTNGSGATVFIDNQGRLGTGPSSQRFKDDIRDMSEASATLFSLRPVSYHYKHDLDPQETAQFGLVAEEVEKIDPALVVHDVDGKPYGVRYEQVNAMLLNEFLKEHATVQAQAAAIAQQGKMIEAALSQIKDLTASMQARAALIQPANVPGEAVAAALAPIP